MQAEINANGNSKRYLTTIITTSFNSKLHNPLWQPNKQKKTIKVLINYTHHVTHKSHYYKNCIIKNSIFLKLNDY